MLEMEIIKPNILEMELSGQAPSAIGGTTNYNELSGKPKINGIELKGDKTLDELNIASKDYVEQEIATFDFIKIVQQLPETGLPNRTYLVSKSEAKDNDLYDEYIWADGWEYLGTKTIEVDLTNYVKFTDYATSTKGGVVKISSSYGLTINSNSGVVTLNPATESDIDDKSNSYKPITPKRLDYVVKSGLSNNSLEWTDEEKTNARTLIDAVGSTDIASGDKAGVVKSGGQGVSVNTAGLLMLQMATEEMIDERSTERRAIPMTLIDYTIKSGMTKNALEWTDEEQESARNLLGVNQFYTHKGFGIDKNAGGYLMINPASETEIDEATNTRMPITVTNLDYAIKKGLSNNTLEWTDEEKTNARDLIGITDLVGDIETLLGGI